jgi:dihydrofolate reductase
MIVVSRGAPVLPEGVHLAATVDDAIERARSYGEDELFVAGGASIYAATLPLADRIYLTRVDADIEGDVHFPQVDLESWREVRREELGADDDNEYATIFRVLEREAPADSG